MDGNDNVDRDKDSPWRSGQGSPKRRSQHHSRSNSRGSSRRRDSSRRRSVSRQRSYSRRRSYSQRRSPSRRRSLSRGRSRRRDRSRDREYEKERQYYSRYYRSRTRSRTPTRDRSSRKRVSPSRRNERSRIQVDGDGYGYDYDWSGLNEQFITHHEYPGWIMSSVTGKWYPMHGQYGYSGENAAASSSAPAAGAPQQAQASAQRADPHSNSGAEAAARRQVDQAGGGTRIQPSLPLTTSPPPPPPTPMGSGAGVEGEQEDVFAMIMSYEEKIRRVIEVMSSKEQFKDLDWEPAKGKMKGASVTMGSVPEKEILGLPAAPRFIMTEFEAFQEDLKSAEKSRPRQKAESGFEGAACPPRPRFAGNSYVINSRPWSESFAIGPVGMIGTSLMPTDLDKSKSTSQVPQYVIPTDRIHGWEASNREALAILTYTDWFMSTVRSMLLDMANRLAMNDVSVETLDSVVVDALEGIQLLESAGRGVRDVAQATVHRICTQTVSRRDAWLKKMTDDCPREEKVELRVADMNASHLFIPELMERAKEALQQNKADKVHSKILGEHAMNKTPSYDRGGRKDGRAPQPSTGERRQISYPKDRGSKPKFEGENQPFQEQRRKPSRRRNRGRGRGKQGNNQGY